MQGSCHLHALSGNQSDSVAIFAADLGLCAPDPRGDESGLTSFYFYQRSSLKRYTARYLGIDFHLAVVNYERRRATLVCYVFS